MNTSRQNIYLLTLSILLLIFVLMFSFMVLIPNGKEYRIKKRDLRRENMELKQLSDFHTKTSKILQKLSSDNKHIITAFSTPFEAQRFEKKHREHFSSLSISKVDNLDTEDVFSVYEVNTTSEISSPKSFYNFLESVNKSDWIVGINFPIIFKRDAELISSSFTMKVYTNSKTPPKLKTTK